MGFLLSIVALLIFIVVHFINAIIVLIVNIKARAYPRTTNKIFYTAARDLDVYGNYAYKTTWNLFLKKKNGYPFGNEDETISSALGKNQVRNKLTAIGWIVVYILWALDYKYWFKGGHALNAIDKE